MKTLEDFDRELGRGGEETMEVPAWIAEQDGVFPEDAGRRTRRSGAEGGSDGALGPAWRGERTGKIESLLRKTSVQTFRCSPDAAVKAAAHFPEVGSAPR